MTDRDKQVVALHQQGRSLRSIGREVNLSHVGVKKALVRLGLVTHNGNPGEEPSPSDDIQSIRSLAESLTSVGNPYSPSFVRSQGRRILALATQLLQGVKARKAALPPNRSE